MDNSSIPTPEQDVNLVVQGKYLINGDTGEILGLADDGPDRFIVDDIGKAEWVLSLMAEEDAEILAVDARLKALTENLASMRRDHENRRNYLSGRFEADLREFARHELEGEKSRTLKTAFGKLSFRATQGSIKVLDEGAALLWAKEFCTDAVKVKETIVVTPLKGREAELPADAFTVTPAGESFKIETGVK